MSARTVCVLFANENDNRMSASRKRVSNASENDNRMIARRKRLRESFAFSLHAARLRIFMRAGWWVRYSFSHTLGARATYYARELNL